MAFQRVDSNFHHPLIIWADKIWAIRWVGLPVPYLCCLNIIGNAQPNSLVTRDLMFLAWVLFGGKTVILLSRAPF